MLYDFFNINEVGFLHQYLTPEEVNQAAENGGFAIIAREKEIVTGIAIVIMDETLENVAKLSYLYVLEGYRGSHIGQELLREVEGYLKKLDIEKLRCDYTGIMRDVVGLSQFMEKAGFEPVILNWHILEYDADALIQGHKLEKLDTSIVGNRIKHLTTEDAAYLCNKDKDIPAYIKTLIRENADLKKSVFCIQKEQIQECVLVSRTENGEMSLLEIYVNPRGKQQVILLYMLADVLSREHLEKLHIQKVFVHVVDNRCYQLYLGLFGNPMRDFRVQRYEKQITKREKKNGTR